MIPCVCNFPLFSCRPPWFVEVVGKNLCGGPSNWAIATPPKKHTQKKWLWHCIYIHRKSVDSLLFSPFAQASTPAFWRENENGSLALLSASYTSPATRTAIHCPFSVRGCRMLPETAAGFGSQLEASVLPTLWNLLPSLPLWALYWQKKPTIDAIGLP